MIFLSFSSLTPDVRPSQLAFEFRTRVIDHRARRAMTSTSTLLRRLAAVIARGSAICRCAIANRGGSDVVTGRDRQPVPMNKSNRLHHEKKTEATTRTADFGSTAPQCELPTERGSLPQR